MLLSRNVHSWSHTIMSEGSLNMKCRRLTCSYRNIGQLFQVAFILCFRPLLFSSEKKGTNFVKTCPNVIRGKKCVISVARKFQNSSKQAIIPFLFSSSKIILFNTIIKLSFLSFSLCLSTNCSFLLPKQFEKTWRGTSGIQVRKRKGFLARDNFLRWGGDRGVTFTSDSQCHHYQQL